MGDGVSDLACRGEASEAETRSYILARIRNAPEGVWNIHKASVSYITHWRLLRRMENEGEVTIRPNNDWMLIETVEHTKEPTE